MEAPAQPLKSPEEELAYLRTQIAAKEAEIEAKGREAPRAQIIEEHIVAHKEAPLHVLHHEYEMPKAEAGSEAARVLHELALGNEEQAVMTLVDTLERRGVKNAFAALDRLEDPKLEDDFHRFLVRYIAEGLPIQDGDDKAPRFKALRMVLYEVALTGPKEENTNQPQKPFREVVSAMEQLYSGLQSLADANLGEPGYYALELAVPSDVPELQFYVAVPYLKRELFEKQIVAIFPDAVVAAQPNDYNIFAKGGVSVGSYASLAHEPMLPLKDFGDFDYDPINSILNAFSKIEHLGEGAALQIIVEPRYDKYLKHYKKVLSELRAGKKRDEAFRTPETTLGEVTQDFAKILFSSKPKDDEAERDRRNHQTEANKTDIEQVEKKIAASIVATTIRVAVSSSDAARATQVLGDIESAFNQFGNTMGNSLSFTRVEGSKAQKLFDAFSFRLPSGNPLPLSLRELTTMYHFPAKGIDSSPHLKQARFTAAPAPVTLDKTGVKLGTNTYRSVATDIYLAPEDRLRHLYVVGQTGTGKTGLMKNLIIQDMQAGNGVCYIDPHGNDILNILECVPPERRADVIYFDPADTAHPFGLNMLEYDAAKPEQKTFIINELFMIFRRLYGDVPESMGPAFEQYFRNATQLVMEDPASGSTMLDIPRVLSNKAFRDLKLSRSGNPIINQFWQEIATKAGGEASLENIVPYITNKFDDFTANDFMRPIIGQQESSFKFRDVIDSKKILLVNLSKGRLGERNANLLGLIIVGKLFMAALSRSDNPRADYPPFYLYVDEFQNVTTDSIPGILSEARKYKLSLTLAHQFLKQIEDKTRDAIFGNVGNMAVFRVGEEDAEYFAKQFAPVFNALDFVNIENRNAYVKILAQGVPQKPFNLRTPDLPAGNAGQLEELVQLSRATYGRDRATVEEMIRARYLA